ncbi:hypothetical protein EJB05_56140, partial [Eragrostis curvula]
MEHQEEGTAQDLPEDVLADVLRRLAPRGLAASRCVCKAWRDAVDARGLLRTDLLPLSLAGLFINFHCLEITEFFSRPSTDPAIWGKHDYLPEAAGVLDNDDENLCVLNPATRWWTALPQCPAPVLDTDFFHNEYLVYDPAVSPHYEVFSIPRFYYRGRFWDYRCDRPEGILDPSVEQSQWPPSPFILHVFSSTTEKWKVRSFVREGEPAGIIANLKLGYRDQYNMICWRGALYVHLQDDFVMRLSLSNDTYLVIKPPPDIALWNRQGFYLGKSEKGVYCASIHERYMLRIWILKESCCKMEWVLTHERSLLEWLTKHKLVSEGKYRSKNHPRVRGPWSLQDLNYYYDEYNKYDKIEAATKEFEWSSEASVDEEFEWSTDDDHNILNNKYPYGYDPGYIDILGFHPYKEIIFLSESITRGLAYHLSTSEIQVLGDLYPTRCELELLNDQFITSAFTYTPCLVEQIIVGSAYSE